MASAVSPRRRRCTRDHSAVPPRLPLPSDVKLIVHLAALAAVFDGVVDQVLEQLDQLVALAHDLAAALSDHRW